MISKENLVKISSLAYHGSSVGGLEQIDPKLDPRTERRRVFLSSTPEHAAIHALLSDRSKANISHKTHKGKFISGVARTKLPLTPKGYLYTIDAKPGESKKPVKVLSSKVVTRDDVESMGWEISKLSENKFRDRVEILVKDERGHVLSGVHKRDFPGIARSVKGSVGFHGGGIDKGEKVEDAAVRELLEESGIKAKNPRVLAVKPHESTWDKNEDFSKHSPEVLKHIKARRAEFKGTRTFFVGADLHRMPKKTTGRDFSPIHKIKFRHPDEIEENLRSYEGGISKDRLKALRLMKISYLVKGAYITHDPFDSSPK